LPRGTPSHARVQGRLRQGPWGRSMCTYGITEQLSWARVPTARQRGAPGGKSRRRTPGVWNEANLAELKGHRTEIEGRRQSLLAEREACERRMEAIRAAAQQVEALTDVLCACAPRYRASKPPKSCSPLRRWTFASPGPQDNPRGFRAPSPSSYCANSTSVAYRMFGRRRISCMTAGGMAESTLTTATAMPCGATRPSCMPAMFT
jgi:hypothetical protein